MCELGPVMCVAHREKSVPSIGPGNGALSVFLSLSGDSKLVVFLFSPTRGGWW